MILLNPIKEEILFRLTAVSILCYRLESKVNGVWLSSLLFGLLHCANFFSVQHEYATNYVVLQCVFAFFIGIFYALEMVITQNLMNVILLHVVNNIFASFVPVTRDVDFGDPIISYMLVVTVVIYAYLFEIDPYWSHPLLKKNIKYFLEKVKYQKIKKIKIN